MDNHHVLYGHGAYGIRIYEIYSVGCIIHIIANGSHYEEVVEKGLAGRSLMEQIRLRVNSRVNNKLDSGFKRSKKELGKFSTNQLGLASPMLATPLKNVKTKITDDCYVQPKLDGHRCLINEDGAYSRNGKVIDTIPEILNSIEVPEGITLDGELYCHGIPLQTISSWAKRRQANTVNLQFHIYDIIVPELKFSERLSILQKLKYDIKFVTKVSTMKLHQYGGIIEAFNVHRQNGFEGSILRPEDGLYEIGKRSKTLIKVKQRFDAEFKCIGMEKSKEGWAVLILATPEGITFKTSAPGTHAEKKLVLDKKEDYIGRWVTCEYAELTKDKVPFHCVAIRWRLDL